MQIKSFNIEQDRVVIDVGDQEIVLKPFCNSLVCCFPPAGLYKQSSLYLEIKTVLFSVFSGAAKIEMLEKYIGKGLCV